MKTDSFINRFLRDFPGAFFTLIGKNASKARKYKFTCVEVKEQAFRFDGVFLPKTKTDHIYFIEAQFKKEKDFYPRFFGEIFLFLRQNQPVNDWRAIVIFPKKATDPGVHQHYQEFFDSGRLQRFYLKQLPEEVLENFPLSLFRIILDSKRHVLSTVQEIVRQLPRQIPQAKEREKVVKLIFSLLTGKFPKLSFEEIKKMMEPLFSDYKKSRALREIAAELTPKIEQELTPKIAQEKARAIAKELLRRQMGVEFIIEVTGLSKREVSTLRRELVSRKNSRSK